MVEDLERIPARLLINWWTHAHELKIIRIEYPNLTERIENRLNVNHTRATYIRDIIINEHSDFFIVESLDDYKEECRFTILNSLRKYILEYEPI